MFFLFCIIMVSKCQLHILFPEDKHVIERQLYCQCKQCLYFAELHQKQIPTFALWRWSHIPQNYTCANWLSWVWNFVHEMDFRTRHIEASFIIKLHTSRPKQRVCHWTLVTICMVTGKSSLARASLFDVACNIKEGGSLANSAIYSVAGL